MKGNGARNRREPRSGGVRSFKTIIPYLDGHWGKIIGGTIFLIVIDVAQIAMPRFIAAAINNILTPEEGLDFVFLMIIGILAAGVIISAGRFFWRYWLAGTGIRVVADLRKNLVSHLQTLSFSFYDKRQVGDLMAHATEDIERIRHAITFGFIIMVDIVFMGIFSIIAMVTLQWPATGMLTLYTLIPLVVLGLIVIRFGGLLRRRWRAVREAFSSLTARVTENLSGIRVVKAYTQEKGETEVFCEVSQDYVRKNINLLKIWGMFFPLIMFLATVAMFLVLLLGGRFVIIADLDIGNFVAFQTYLGMLIWPMIAIGWLINLIQSGAASMGRLNRLFAVKPEIADDAHTLALEEIKGKVRFEKLTFHYEGMEHPALKNVSLELHPGKILGIIGTLGSGKSTLVNLIQRLYEAPQGSVTVDGHDIRRIPLKLLRSSVGMVPQDTFLFSQTVRENIAFGLDREFTFEEIEGAAKIAGIHSEIMKFPQGYETMLGERGVTVSGGQKQRLTIARAVLTDPKILILDDALSAVDADTEIEILTSLKDILRKRSVIIISARPRSLAFADEILVMDEGHIVERGRHEELIAKDGLYALFARLQGVN